TQMMHLRDPETGAHSWHLLLGPNVFRPNDASGTDYGVRGGVGESGMRGVAHRVADARYNAKHKFQSLGIGRPKSESRNYRTAIAEATLVHEFGHGLHTAHDPSQWLRVQQHAMLGTQPVPSAAPSAMDVSHYATNSGLEFVAEVFTAQVYGESFPAGVRNDYAEWGGPPLPSPQAPPPRPSLTPERVNEIYQVQRDALDEQLAQIRSGGETRFDTVTSSDGGITVRVEHATRDPDWPVKKDALQG
ncbi:hypothetical protein, partial [Actinoalloteichus spitiensis]|uniref:hypothetical protein n=1 Tax=Actinoalloteichus spitiensis TaxID=252394 RepID=UPI0012F69D26